MKFHPAFDISQLLAMSDQASERLDENVGEKSMASKSGIGDVVASHYNNLQERGKAARNESR